MRSMLYYVRAFSDKAGERIRLWVNRRNNDGTIRTSGRLILRRNSEVLVRKDGLMSTGEGTVTIREGTRVTVETGGRLLIGNDVGINRNCYIAVHEEIVIGNNTIFGPGVVVVDQDHDFRDPGGLKAGRYKTGRIRIGNNVWIGANAVVLRNTDIGDNSVIGAGCVVRGNVEPGSVIKRIDNECQEYNQDIIKKNL